MRGMILAAGLGNRMGPISRYLAKPAVPFLGVPIIEHSIGVLRSAGIKEIVINLHHLPDTITSLLDDGSRYGVEITYSHEDPLLGTGGGIANVKDFFRGDTFVVLNSDVIIDVDLAEVISSHKQKGAEATLLLRVDKKKAYGKVFRDDKQRIRKIEGYPDLPVDSSWKKFMFAGLHIIEPSWFEYAPDSSCFDSITDVYSPMLKAGKHIHGHRYSGRWTDVGSARRILSASVDNLVGNIIPNPAGICEQSTIHQSVLSPLTTVGSNCQINRVFTIGEVVIGDGCNLRRCIVCPDTNIPSGTTAKRAVFAGDEITELEDLTD